MSMVGQASAPVQSAGREAQAGNSQSIR